jgi:membrane-associated phospholipid phosphatase
MEPSPPLPPLQGGDDAAWLLVAGLMIPICALELYDPFRLSWNSLLLPGAFVAVLAAAALVYRYKRPDEKIVAMVVALQQLVLFTCLGILLSYMIAARGGAYWDSRFQRWDLALGLDWRSYLDFVNAHPLLGRVFSLAYASLMPQMIAVILALGLSGRLLALRMVALAAILSGTATILLSGLMPGMANFVHLGLGPQDYPNLHPAAAFVHVSDLAGLRDGTLRTVSLESMQGIITFPSYHAALATVFAWGFWRAPAGVRWPGLVLAALTLLSTPIDGGHYFVDTFAGMALGALGLAAAPFLARRGLPPPWKGLRAGVGTRLGSRVSLQLHGSHPGEGRGP